MARFEVCKFDGEQAYNNAMDLKNEIAFNEEDSGHKSVEEKREELDEMFKYAPQKWEVSSWSEVKEYLNKHDYTMWRELGELEERVICEKCGATIRTNSDELVEEKKDTHQIQVCPADKR
jgi:hypothetical protein